MEKGPISKRQKDILEFIKNEIRLKGYPPSVRDICEGVHFKSTSSVHSHLAVLEKNGYIRRDPAKPRAIEINDESFYGNRRNIEEVPLVGTVAAGQPLLAVENIEAYFPIPSEYLPGTGSFMLRVKGDSMIEAGILDGDLVLVAEQHTAKDGEIVVALVEDSATVKTFYREDGQVRLQPENRTMEPIIVKEDLMILGRVVGVMRFF